MSNQWSRVGRTLKSWRGTANDIVCFKKARLKPLKEGDHIDLGDKRVDVLHLPGHSPGSIGLRWDEFLVTGDTVYGTDHELIDW